MCEAATSSDPGAIGLVTDYQHNALFGTMLVLYIGGLLAGCMLLAIALWRERAVPRWAAIAVGAFPIIGLVYFPAGAALAVAGFGACALTLRRGAVHLSPADAVTRMASAQT